MDQDVNNLLDAWGFSHYKDIFAANKIDLNSFALLTEELIKELVGPIGDRAKFSKNLKDWISLTNPNEAQQQSVSHTEVDAISDKHRAIPCAIKYIVNQEQEATSPLSFESIEINNISTFDIIDISNCSNNNLPLKELLRQTLEGRALLRVYSESGLLYNTGRRKILNTNLLTPSTQETTSIYAFIFLPLLLGNPVAKNEKKSWRPSKQEAREAFITHVRAATELQPTISRRKEKYATYGLTFQPTIFIVGPTFLYGNFTFY
ncbi:hypothetical protein ACJJTC_002976 [Scirpophaga incertulas]